MANPIFANLPTTIFEEMSGLARELGAINLGQGFPDAPGPQAIRERFEELAERIMHGPMRDPDSGTLAEMPELQALEAELIGCLRNLLTHADRAA